MIFLIRHTFDGIHTACISLESYLKIDHRVNKLLPVEVFNIIIKLQPNTAVKWKATKISLYLRKRVIVVVFVFVI